MEVKDSVVAALTKHKRRVSARTRLNSADALRPRSVRIKGVQYQLNDSNLKFMMRPDKGLLYDLGSDTTQVISGHNTPLTYQKKKKEKYLSQINKDQDDLLEHLKEKDRKLALRSLKASRLFHTFVSNMG